MLANLLLDGLGKELERRGHRFVRYADDCVRHEARAVHGAKAPTAGRRAVSLPPSLEAERPPGKGSPGETTGSTGVVAHP